MPHIRDAVSDTWAATLLSKNIRETKSTSFSPLINGDYLFTEATRALNLSHSLAGTTL